MKIEKDRVVRFHYAVAEAGQAPMESSKDVGEPLAILFGHGQIIPGLEKAMLGRSVGDAFDVVVAPEEGYGEPNEMLVQVVPRAAFQGVEELAVGMEFQAHTPQGPMSVAIAKIEGDEVTVDGNHPLAGRTLHFAIEVTDVREASLEEVMHGHVHGEGGHHH